MAPGPSAESQRSTPRKAPNLILRRIREQERHETRAEFAEAMAGVARDIGESVYPDAKYVERLESGDIRYPGPVYRRILTQLCHRQASQLGFVAPGLAPPDSSVSGQGDSSDADSISLGQRLNTPLRDAILASGLEVTEVARKVGIDPKSVQRWITTGRIPHTRHRWKACEILGREESELWPEVGPRREAAGNETVKADSQLLSGHGSPGAHPEVPGSGQGDIRPMLTNMSEASAVAALSVLREIQRGYVLADRLMGGLSVTGAVTTQIPVVERACEITRGADRAGALEFACRFMEFCGWAHQDAGDLTCAMYWTDRAFDYAMELGDRRTIAYTLMRKASIATEAGNPAQGLGIANFALASADVLTPRLRGVILRQRAHAHAALREVAETERDSDNAIAEAIAGISQGEEDRAPYCSPMYVAMETGQSMVVAGRPETALQVLAGSRSEWSDRGQVRDYALCVSRLATAYAAAGDPENACATAEEAISLAHGLGSRRVIDQLNKLSGALGRWRTDIAITGMQEKLNVLVDSFQPEYARSRSF